MIISLMLCMLLPVQAQKQLRSGPIIAHRVYDENGVWLGTARREDTKFELFDLKGMLVENPAKFLNQPAEDCYLYDIRGYAFGKCTSSRVIIFNYNK